MTVVVRASDNDSNHKQALKYLGQFPADIFLFKVNNRNTRTMHEFYSKFTMKTPERRQWRRSNVFIVYFEQISCIVLVFLFITLNK